MFSLKGLITWNYIRYPIKSALFSPIRFSISLAKAWLLNALHNIFDCRLALI
jgi:hypothetical protein